MARTPEIVYAELDADQRRVYDAIIAGPRGQVQAPLKVWLQSAELADRDQGRHRSRRGRGDPHRQGAEAQAGGRSGGLRLRARTADGARSVRGDVSDRGRAVGEKGRGRADRHPRLLRPDLDDHQGVRSAAAARYTGAVRGCLIVVGWVSLRSTHPTCPIHRMRAGVARAPAGAARLVETGERV